MRIEQLYYFVTVAEAKNISLVADKLLISQPRLSSNISALEKELNTKLLYRTGHGVELTDIGKAVVPFAKAILANSEEIHNITKKQDSFSELSVSLNPIARNIFLSEIFPKLNSEFQINNFQIIENYPKEVINDVISGKAHLGISAGTQLAIRNIQIIAADNNLDFAVLPKTDTLCFISNRDNHLATKDIISFKELQEENLARFKGGHPRYSYSGTTAMYKDFSKLSFFDNYESLFYSVSLQNMVSIVPVSLARDNAYVQNGQIIMKPLCDYPTEIQYYCVNHKKVSVLEKRCLELILNLLK